MRLASYETGDAQGYGVINADDMIIPLGDGPGAPASVAAWLAGGFGEGDVAGFAGEPVSLSEVRLLPPIPAPGKIFCVATNFHEPSRQGKPAPDYPLLFTRYPDTLVGHGQPLCKPPTSSRFDFEGEVAVVIGKAGFQIPPAEAMAHVGGYACFNDGSVRDWQKHSSQFTPGKNFVRSGSFGPWLVTADAVAAPSGLTLETRVNGVLKQAIGLDRFIFDIPWLIAYISTFSPLAPGDVIATGTPSGFGSTREPPEFLQAGDIIEVAVPGIGTLSNPVREGYDI
ncbi:5-carboxymethyl-2-hydroxymuconate isomerase [Hyphomicrobiales bacterium]|nr:5-carboxymethyl-2-hydroxymuconate isomerase [Hyphomicrobiales bacterium]CAH1674858.1 5-carboxymethyl-2-hydroxymuconate isomerase [Hyphomicrobiales bacterium]